MSDKEPYRVTLQYFDGCPNWEATSATLSEVALELSVDVAIEYQLVETQEEAERVQFRGSPTVLINGVDPFADERAPIGLSCRVYRTETGFAGSPSRAQLREVLTTNH